MGKKQNSAERLIKREKKVFAPTTHLFIHIIDFSGPLYNKCVTVCVCEGGLYVAVSHL